MQKNNLVGLAIISLVAAIFAFILVGRDGEETKSVGNEGKMFADFLGQANEVTSIQIDNGEQKFTIVRSGDTWIVEEKSGYPAKFEFVKQAIIDVGELELTARKTDDPARHKTLGLEAPSELEGSAIGIEFLNGEGQSLASLLVGDKARSGQDVRYVRHPDSNQTWLGSGGPEVGVEAFDWIEKNLMQVRHDRIRRIMFLHSDGEKSILERSDRTSFRYSYKDIPEGMKMASPAIVNSTGGVLSFLNLLDVNSVSAVSAMGEPVSITELETWDGLVVTASIYEFEENSWVNFDAVFDAGLVAPQEDVSSGTIDEAESADANSVVREEAETIRSRHQEWVYLIDEDKIEKLRRRSGDLLVEDVPESTGDAPVSDGVE